MAIFHPNTSPFRDLKTWFSLADEVEVPASIVMPQLVTATENTPQGERLFMGSVLEDHP